MNLRFSTPNLWMNIFLWSAFLNAVLKPYPESDVTLFRLLLPIGALLFFSKHKSILRKFLTITAIFLLLQSASLLFGIYPISLLQLIFISHYLVMILFFFIVLTYIEKFPSDFYRMLRTFYILLVLFMTFQYFTEFRLPNTNDRGLNGWYWNQNDASLALAGFIILAIRAGDMGGMILLHVLAIFLMAENGSRAAMWGTVAYFAIWNLLALSNSKHWGSLTNSIVVSGVSAVGICMLVIVFKDRFGEVLDQLILVPEVLFGSSDTFSIVTSIGVRSYALLYAIEDFRRSFGIGTGAGNSIAMLQLTNAVETSLVKSIHNMPMQMVLELGLPLITILIFGLRRYSPLHWFDFMLVLAVHCFVSLSQSGGFIVNYFPLVCFYFAVLMPVGLFSPISRTTVHSMEGFGQSDKKTTAFLKRKVEE